MKTNRSPFRDSDIDRVNELTDLVELVGQYSRVRRTGVSFTASCIFHKETTPSFGIDPRKNLWLCRGCQAAGNPIQFLMRAERIPFTAAVKILAARAGVSLADTRDSGNQRAYDEAIAAEAGWYWGRVRRSYQQRCDLRARMAYDMVAYRDDVEDSWEAICLQVRCKRSWDRWERILGRLDATDKAILVDKYRRIRILRPKVVSEYRRERDLKREFMTKAKAAIVAMPPAQFTEMWETVLSHVSDGSQQKT